jgi:hypothetical protein
MYMFCKSLVVCPFVPFLLAIVLSVLLPFTDFDNPFRIFKLFFLRTYLNHENPNVLIAAYVNVWTPPQTKYQDTFVHI